MPALLLWPLLVFFGIEPAAPGGLVLDEAQTHYLEDGNSGRRLAVVTARACRDVDGVRVVVRISALGHGVEAVHGYHGVPGSNHITVREMRRLLRQRRLHLSAYTKAGAKQRGEVFGGRHGVVAERRFVPEQGGFVTADAGAVGPVELVCVTEPLGVGTWQVELKAERHVRLRVVVCVDTDVRIRSIESLGTDLFR